ncbi:hypothetical protein BJX96DRAFT_18557 [Aspergillus floccosus]
MPVLQHERIAIIGGGCTGTTCFWALQNTAHDVHLFEASSTLGGRIKEYWLEDSGNKRVINTETPTFNAETSRQCSYNHIPAISKLTTHLANLMSLLRHLGISTSAIPFNLSTSDGITTFEWGSSIAASILRQPWVLFNIETYRTLVDVIWFKYFGIDALSERHSSGKPENLSVHLNADEYLTSERYSNSFFNRYLSPLLSVLWRTNALKSLPKFPMKALVRSLNDHKFFCTWQTIPQWRRIDSGVRQLTQTMAKVLPAQNLHLRTRIQEIQRLGKDRYKLVTADGDALYFNHIVFAIDGRETLKILRLNVDSDEKEILQDLRAGPNILVLHSDYSAPRHAEYPRMHSLNSFIPFHQLAPDLDHSWPACNYIMSPAQSPNQSDRQRTSDSVSPRSSLTYNVNALQDVPVCLFGRIFVTVNPFTPPHPRLVHAVWEFTDLEPTPVTLRAQSRLSSIQNKRGLSYGCRWSGRGFLEDSVSAGLEIATEHFGAQLPFKIIHHEDLLEDSTEVLHLKLSDHFIRTVLSFVRAYVLICEICWLLLRKIWTRPVSYTT